MVIGRRSRFGRMIVGCIDRGRVTGLCLLHGTVDSSSFGAEWVTVIDEENVIFIETKCFLTMGGSFCFGVGVGATPLVCASESLVSSCGWR